MDLGSFVLAASTADLGEEPAAREHADAVEFRMDLAAEPLAALSAYDGELPVVATNRARWEGGGAGGDGPGDDAERDRLTALEAAAELPSVAAVDVELRAVEDGDGERAVAAARANDAAAIVSVHDHEGTPDRDALRDLLERACETGDVGKLSVAVDGPADVLDLLSATHELTEAGRRVATTAMGEPGRHARAIAPLYGSRLGYAPVRADRATAPGQLDLATLRELVSLFGVAGQGSGRPPAGPTGRESER